MTYELKKVSLLRVYLTTCPSQYLETDNTSPSGYVNKMNVVKISYIVLATMFFSI